jgi:hypothetical protein
MPKNPKKPYLVLSRPATALKQKKVLDILGDNGGNLRDAITRAGYSQKYADNPQRLLNTQTWREIMDETFPDSMLAVKHRQLLEKEEIVILKKKNKIEIVRTGEIDVVAVAKGLDMAYKLKNSYKESEKEPEEYRISKIIIINPLEDEFLNK